MLASNPSHPSDGHQTHHHHFHHHNILLICEVYLRVVPPTASGPVHPRPTRFIQPCNTHPSPSKSDYTRQFDRIPVRVSKCPFAKFSLNMLLLCMCVSFSFVLYSPYWGPHPTRNPQKASDEMTNWFSTRSSVGTAECVGAFHGTRATSIVRLMIVTSFGRRDMMRMGNHITILRPRMWYRPERTGKQVFFGPVAHEIVPHVHQHVRVAWFEGFFVLFTV